MTEAREQALYWQELVRTRLLLEYTTLCRDRLRSRITQFTALKAGVSVTALGGWAVVQSHPIIWGGIIVAAQVVDAVWTALPYPPRFAGLNEIVPALQTLFIDCQLDWELIASGQVRGRTISRKRRQLMTRQIDLQTQQFPTGLPERPDLMRLAETRATAYIRLNVVGVSDGNVLGHR